MFLKKSLLFMTALALLMFTGQASAQGPSVSLEHVSDTAGMVSGQGTTITVRISQTGVNDIPGIATAAGINIDVAFDASVVSLATPLGFFRADTATGTTLTLPAFPGQPLSVPASADLTFTTVADVTGMEFSIGITGVSTIIAGQNVAIPISETLTFNEADDGGTPPPMPTGPTVSLTSGGESEINRIGPDTDIVVDIGIGGVDAATMVAGGKITFNVDPSVATVKSMMAGANVIESESSGLNVVIAFPPATLPADGKLGSVTFTTNSDYTREKFEISVTSLELIITGENVDVTPVGALVVNDFSPYLEADPADAAISFPAGESRTVTVTAMDLQDEAVAFTVATTGDVTASEDAEAGTVTLTATGDGTASVEAIAAGVELEFPVSVAFDAYPVLNTDKDSPVEIPRDGEATVKVTAVGFDTEPVLSINGAAGLKKSDDGVSWDVTTSTPGDVVVTATLGNDSAETTITFEAEPPELEASAAEATIPVGGSAEVVVTALGLGDGVNYSYTETGTADVDLVTDGAMATVTASGRGSATVTVTANDADGRTAEGVTIMFNEGQLSLSSADPVMVPVGGSGSTMVTVSGQANDDDVTFTVEGVESSQDGATVTLTGTGAATATVTASVGGVTATTTVEFADGPLALEASAEAVSVAPGGMGMATVTLMGLAEGETPSFAIDPAEHGTVDGNVVTLSASGDATVTVSATVGSLTTAEATVEFSLGDLTLALAEGSMAENAVMPGGSASAMFAVTGQADGAEVVLALEDGSEGATLDGMTVSASGDATAIVTAWVGDIGSDPVTVTFALGDLTLALAEGSMAENAVMPGGSASAMFAVTGQADGAEVVLALEDGSEGATLDGMTVSASGDATAIVTAWVGDIGSNAVTVMFALGDLTLSADATVVEIGPDGGMTMVTASGQDPDADVMFSSDNDAVMVTENEDGASATVSASSAGMAMITAAVGDVSASVGVSFVPSLHTEMDVVEVPLDGSPATAVISTVGFPPGATITFNTSSNIDIQSSDDGSTLTVTSRSPGDVMVTANDGTNSVSTTITFVGEGPKLEASAAEATIPVGGSVEVEVAALGYADDAEISFQTNVKSREGTEGKATVDTKRGDASLTLTATGRSGAVVTVTASDGTTATDPIDVTFMAGSLALEAAKSEVMVPVGGTGSTTVTVSGQANDDDVTFAVEGEGVMSESDGATVTLSASGAATATVTASVGEVSSESITVMFVDGTLQLVASVSEAVMVAPGGTETATVSLMNLAEGDEATFSVDAEGVEHSIEGVTVTLSATGDGSATVTAAVNGLTTNTVSIEFVQGALTAALAEGSEAENTVLPGGSASATVMASGQAEGAEVVFALEEGSEGVTLDGATVSASGAGTAIVTAWVGDVGSNAVTIEFAQGALTAALAEGSEAMNTVLPGGSASATVMASGQAEGAEVVFALEEGSEGVTLDGATVSASGAGTAIVTAWVGEVGSNAVTIEFAQGALTAALAEGSEAMNTVLPGGSASATVMASGQAEGAEVVFALEEGSEGVTLDGATVSASGAGTAIVTAWVGEVGSNAVTIEFAQGALMLSDPGDAIIPYGESGSATLTASGQADGAEVEFTVEGEGVTAASDGATVTVSASAPTMAMVTAAVGGVMSNTVEVAFVDAPPELRTETPTVTFADFGETGEATVTAVGFPEDAQITFKIIGGTGFATADGAATWTVSTAVAGVVTLEATDGTMTTAPLDITFMNPRPYLTASDLDAIIPAGGNVIVTVTATGLDADSIVWTFTEVSGTATVNTETHGATATLTGSGEGSASVTLMAKDDVNSTEPVTIVFRAMPTVSSETPNVTIPPTTAPVESATVTVNGFAEDTEVEIAVVVVSGEATHTIDGNTVTISASGSAVVMVTATGDGITTDPVTVTFTKNAPAAPANLVVEDNPGDHGYYVMVSFPNSANHLDVSQYRIWREMDVTTELGEDGTVRTTDDPTKAWVAWAAVDAVPSEEGVTRAVVPVTDNTATRWGVSAEVGRASAEEVITPSGKRVFSKESVQLMAQILGLDPNAIVSEDELAQMFMPSADYIQSIIGDRKNVVFAALDPDMSVLIGDVTVPQNIRTDGHLNPILSSPITVTDGMMGAVDDTAPAVVTDVTADPDTGLITWTVSADDMTVGMINYRGYSFTIPGVLGYKVMAGASPDALAIDVTQLVVETGVLPAGTSSLQVPRALIETLINQGLPAVFVSVVAMDGTNLSGSVPLMVELAPKRKAFVDADGNPVYIVDLNDGNLTVGFEDFIAFRMAYNTSEATSTREEWRVFIQADLNDDTMVDFADFILFFGSYGREAIGPSGKSLIPPLGVNESAEFLLRLGSERVVVGENMFVDVSLANVQALMGYGFVLHYDAENFEFVEAVPAAEDLLKSAGGETPLFRGWSPEAGQVHVMNAVANGSEVSGDGDIVRLVFRVLRDFEDNARFEIAEGLVFDPSQLANPLTGGVLDIQTTPTEFALLQNFPNPFNPETTIGYELAESADVTLQIYNVVGQVVRTLMAAEPQSVGRYQVRWDGMDDRGMPVSSGIYFYQISAAGKFQDVRKLMLLK